MENSLLKLEHEVFGGREAKGEAEQEMLSNHRAS